MAAGMGAAAAASTSRPAERFSGRTATPADHLIRTGAGEQPFSSGRRRRRLASTSIPFAGACQLLDELLNEQRQPQTRPAAESTRVAFATADIRRALAAQLNRSQQSVWRPTSGADAPRRAALGRRYKTGRDRRQQPCDTASASTGSPATKDDLCLSSSSAGELLNPLRPVIAFCPTLTAKSAPAGAEARAFAPHRKQQLQLQQEQQTSKQPAGSRRQQKVFFLSKRDCKRESEDNEPEQQQEQQLGQKEYQKSHSSLRSGSISMNHLNEIKTSAAAAICRASSAAKSSSRSGSYGVSCAASELTLNASSSSSSSPLAADTCTQARSWWLSRMRSGAGAPSSKKSSWKSESVKRHNSKQIDLSHNAKFVLHRNSTDLQEAADASRESEAAVKFVRSTSEQQVTYCKHKVNEQAMATSVSVAGQANRMAASLDAANELLHADEMHNSTSSTLSGAGLSGSGGLGAAGQNKNFGKLVGKKAARLKELVLQNLGKADRTQDELFDLYEVNFYKQQQQVSKLTKEFKSYVAALRHFHEASGSLNKCIQQSTSDYQSARHDLVCENLSQLEALNEDLLEKLGEQVLKQVGEYLSKFGEMKEKISKRHRKLIDYDKSRRLYELILAQVNKRRAKQNASSPPDGQPDSDNYQSILRGLKFLSQQQETATSVTSQQELIASQLVEEARLLKFREQFNYSKLMYESINGELHDELPIVYEKKMKSLLAALQSYFALETHYHSNAAKLVGTVSEVIDEMPHCAGLQQASMEARKLSLSGPFDCNNNNNNNNNDHSQEQTIVDCEIEEEEEDDEVDDDEDDDFYESGSSSDSRAGRRGASGPGCPDEEKTRKLNGNAGGSSSGLGSSRGDSSCSVGSSSPECPAKHEEIAISAGPAIVEQPAEDTELECAAGSGKAEQPAGCSTGAAVAAAAAAKETPSALVTIAKPEVESVGAQGRPTAEPPSEPIESTEIVDVLLEEPIEKAGEEVGELGAGVEEVGAAATRAILYKVRTNYKYLAEDVDELCFEPHEIIQVIEFEPHQEPEEGWLMGIREINGQRGLFPANFTELI